jgi:hypothetical protein
MIAALICGALGFAHAPATQEARLSAGLFARQLERD